MTPEAAKQRLAGKVDVVLAYWHNTEGIIDAVLAEPGTVMAALGAEKEWLCDYPEFVDTVCMVSHHPPATSQPRKHTGCGWRWTLPTTRPRPRD